MESNKKRLVTRIDFDGLVCAILLKEINLIDEIIFVHPKDMQDRKIEITGNDIITNLPYVEGAYLVFDHHHSETKRITKKDNHIIAPYAPSTARVIYDYYGGKKAFPRISEELMKAVDKGDSGGFSMEEILNPKGWDLLNFIMDPRTGLGRFKDFRITNYELMLNLIDYCANHTIDEILNLPDVKERVDLYFEHAEPFKDQLERCSKVYSNVVVLDLRDENVIYAGNRFMIYALYPECNSSIHVLWGVKKRNTVIAVGKSIFNRTCKTNIGELMLKYNGGGHTNAGTCQVDNDKADEILNEIIDTIIENG